jgi:hypothetical protein
MADETAGAGGTGQESKGDAGPGVAGQGGASKILGEIGSDAKSGASQLEAKKEGEKGATTPEWANKLSPELQNLVSKKGWQTQEQVFESYTALESKLGAGPNELLRLPKEGDQAALDEFYTKLGRPAKPEDYKTELKFAEGEPNFLDWFRKAAHTEGVSQKAFESLAKGFEEQRLAGNAAVEGEFVAESTKAINALKSEWGNSWDSNIALAKSGAKTLGFGQEVLNAVEREMGTEAMLKTMLKVGLSVADTSGGMHGSEQSAGAMTAEQARGEIAKMNADGAAMAAWNDPQNPSHPEVKRKMDRFFKIAYPG